MVHTYLFHLIGCGFHGYGCEIINVRETEHMIEDIEYKDGVIPAGKFAERSFLRHSFHRQAVLSEFLDIHFPMRSISTRAM